MIMDIDKKKKLVEELLAHLDQSQGSDLGKMVMASKKPAIEIDSIKAVRPEDAHNDKIDQAIGDVSKDDDSNEDPKEEDLESPKDEALEASNKPGDDDELSDEELAELLKKYLKE